MSKCDSRDGRTRAIQHLRKTFPSFTPSLAMKTQPQVTLSFGAMLGATPSGFGWFSLLWTAVVSHFSSCPCHQVPRDLHDGVVLHRCHVPHFEFTGSWKTGVCQWAILPLHHIPILFSSSASLLFTFDLRVRLLSNLWVESHSCIHCEWLKGRWAQRSLL